MLTSTQTCFALTYENDCFIKKQLTPSLLHKHTQILQKNMVAHLAGYLKSVQFLPSVSHQPFLPAAIGTVWDKCRSTSKVCVSWSLHVWASQLSAISLKLDRGSFIHLLHCCGIPVMHNCWANKDGLRQPIIFIRVIYCKILDPFFKI